MSSSTNDYLGQHVIFYYQSQPPADYNQSHQYRNHITTQPDPCRTDYDTEKVDKRGGTHSGIPSLDIKQSPIIPLCNVQYYRKKTPTVSSVASLKT